VAVCPAATVALRLPVAAGNTLNADLALPLRVTVCGEDAPSLVTVIVAECAPLANGANATLRMQLASGE
jgi:hypothetical protein